MTQEDFGASVRALLQIIGGVAMTKGWMSDGDVALYSGAVISVAAWGWSLWQKRKAEHDRKAAYAVGVTTTPAVAAVTDVPTVKEVREIAAVAAAPTDG